MKIKNIEKFKNYAKIKKLSNIKIMLWETQQEKINNFYFYWGKLEEIIKNSFKGIDPSVLLMNLVDREAQISSLIEGSKTQFEDLSYDIEEIDNVYSWETRNLINLYKKLLEEIDNDTFFLSKDSIRNMHKELYQKNTNGKFNVTFDPKEIIKKIKPGKIINDDNNLNWIGQKNCNLKLEENLKNATLIPVKPSLKEEYLNDLCKTITNKIKNKKPCWNEIIAFHPIFEAIHPFSDGNGRIGRLLLTLIFKMVFPKRKTLINFSNVINKNKEEYFEQLRNVQVNNDSKAWEAWTEYFVNLLEKVQNELITKIRSITRLWNSFTRRINMQKNPLKIKILKYFFQYYKLNKKHTIKKLVSKGYSQAGVYRAFDFVVKEIGAKTNDRKYYSLEKIKEIIVDDKEF